MPYGYVPAEISNAWTKNEALTRYCISKKKGIALIRTGHLRAPPRTPLVIAYHAMLGHHTPATMASDSKVKEAKEYA